MKKLTVLLLCWNHARFLEQCIAALAAQTVRPHEIVFLDNNSSDGSLELASSLFHKYGLKAKILENRESKGIARNLNRLNSEANGELIAPLSTDDWYAPAYVECMLADADADSEAAWFYPSGWTFVEETGVTLPIADSHFRSGNVRAWMRTLEWPFGFVGLCYRKAVIDEMGGWDESLPVEDNDMMFRLGMSRTCRHVEAKLVYYRRFSGTVSTNLLFCADATDKFFHKHRQEIDDADAKHSEMLRAFAAMAVDRGNLTEAKPLLARAIRRAPWRTANLRTVWYYLRTAITKKQTRAT